MPEMNYTPKEIEAEVCFLFLNKIFENKIQSLKSIKNNYEKEIIQYIIYKVLFKKLNEILDQEKFNDNNKSNELTTLIEKKLSECEGNNKLTLKKN